MQVSVNKQTLELVVGDITRQEVDAIVNAANSRLAGGGGVDGAIHRSAGPRIMAETNEKYADGCPTGSAVISGAGELSAKYVIHAVGPVGPVWHGGAEGEPTQLAGAYRRCLELAVARQCESIAFPAISCGVYGYPLRQASDVALRAVSDFLMEQGKPNLVRFVLFGEETYDAFARTLRSLTIEGENER